VLGASSLLFGQNTFGENLKSFCIAAGCAFCGCYIDSLIGCYFQASYLKENKVENEKGGQNIGGYPVFSNGMVNLAASLIAAGMTFFW
jgi:uncharacterized membrane protein